MLVFLILSLVVFIVLTLTIELEDYDSQIQLSSLRFRKITRR